MSERLEYSGDPLPSGLPGFGGGTITVLPLPGFSRVVAAQKFGPVVDAPGVTVPDDTPPIGSNPEDPTDEVVEPGPLPSPGPAPTFNKNFCTTCRNTTLTNNKPILYGKVESTPCVDCSGNTKTVQFLVPDTTEISYTGGGIRFDGIGRWEIDSFGVMLDEDLYQPEDLEVCEGGETKTWKVLAYKP
jgi:hypothetical protein